jgi:hypothetical protein
MADMWLERSGSVGIEQLSVGFREDVEVLKERENFFLEIKE